MLENTCIKYMYCYCRTSRNRHVDTSMAKDKFIVMDNVLNHMKIL